MKKADVRIGGVYLAKVTNKQVEVRIDEAKTNGGRSATNHATGRKVTIKTARRLTEIPVGSTKATKSDNPAVVENETAEAFDSTSAKPKRASQKPKQGTTSESKNKKMSCINAALAVLADSGEPMNAKEMIDAMEAKGLWTSPGGKTPHATLYSAILRDLAKGDESRFVKTERGKFTARG